MASYAYDYLGRRVSRTIYGAPDATIKYAYDGDRIIAEYDANDVLLRKFIYGPGIDEPICLLEVADNNAVYYYHFDGLGSVVALSDVNSVLVERYTYDVFGRPAIREANGTEIAESAFANPYLFTGRAYDAETGLYYYRARYYDYATGRFLQPDPTGYTDGLNLYAYVGNNPGGFVDPFGLCKEQSWLERSMLGFSSWGVAFSGTVSNFVDSMIYAALHPWTLNPWNSVFHAPQILAQGYGAVQQFLADVTSPDAERNGAAIGRLTGFVFTALAMVGIMQGVEEASVAQSAGPVAEATNSFNYGNKIEGQMGPRGWSDSLIDETISQPVATSPAMNKAGGASATAYYGADGSYVVRVNTTGEIIQVSNRNNPNWIPDSTIQNPYRPK